MPRKTPTKASRSAESDSKEKSFDVTTHILVPKHELCTAEEKKAVLEAFGIQPTQLPRINPHDPAIRHLSVKQGDVIKITRNSPTAGESVYYRIVASE